MSKQNRPSPPNANKIAKYWYSKSLEKNEDGIYFFSKIIDIGEPACFGCGTWCTNSTTPDDWNSHCLEKAHIIPFSSGGLNDPSNFLLLCRHCHFDFDNEIYIDNMQDFHKVNTWLENRPNIKNEIINKGVASFIKENNYDEKKFTYAFARTVSTNNIFTKTKSLEEYLYELCINAATIYPLITNNHISVDVFTFLQGFNNA